MKRHGNLFERIVDIDNLEEAYNKAKRGKTGKRTWLVETC